MTTTIDPRVLAAVAAHPYPLPFVTISGSHLYGFSSPDSDVDLRGVHLLRAEALLGLDLHDETVESSEVRAGLEVDYVTHDLRKFVAMMLKRNGYVLEQLYSPLVVRTSAVHAELKALGAGCITRHHAHHYRGFAHTQWELFLKEQPRRVKPLLYVYRVLLTGIHLMRSGRIECDLNTLNADAGLDWLPELIARKTGTREQATLDDGDIERHRATFAQLMQRLDDAAAASSLPDSASSREALDELIVRVRLATLERLR
ncbi:MAG TPA: nucleotidyltransferase domain-containing protein [Planctomycetota bacterium]|nr:nucleotidyltransferase domain-containing protein [Planctomycetota bacterium]